MATSAAAGASGTTNRSALILFEPLLDHVQLLVRKVAHELQPCEAFDCLAALDPCEVCGLLCSGALEQASLELQPHAEKAGGTHVGKLLLQLADSAVLLREFSMLGPQLATLEGDGSGVEDKEELSVRLAEMDAAAASARRDVKAARGRKLHVAERASSKLACAAQERVALRTRMLAADFLRETRFDALQAALGLNSLPEVQGDAETLSGGRPAHWRSYPASHLLRLSRAPSATLLPLTTELSKLPGTSFVDTCAMDPTLGTGGRRRDTAYNHARPRAPAGRRGSCGGNAKMRGSVSAQSQPLPAEATNWSPVRRAWHWQSLERPMPLFRKGRGARLDAAARESDAEEPVDAGLAPTVDGITVASPVIGDGLRPFERGARFSAGCRAASERLASTNTARLEPRTMPPTEVPASRSNSGCRTVRAAEEATVAATQELTVSSRALVTTKALTSPLELTSSGSSPDLGESQTYLAATPRTQGNNDAANVQARNAQTRLLRTQGMASVQEHPGIVTRHNTGQLRDTLPPCGRGSPLPANPMPPPSANPTGEWEFEVFSMARRGGHGTDSIVSEDDSRRDWQQPLRVCRLPSGNNPIANERQRPQASARLDNLIDRSGDLCISSFDHATQVSQRESSSQNDPIAMPHGSLGRGRPPRFHVATEGRPCEAHLRS